MTAPDDPGRRAVDRFLDQSELNELTGEAFLARAEAFAPSTHEVSIFDHAAGETPLPRVNDRTQRVFEARHSVRAFGDQALSTDDLALVFAATGVGPDGRRVVPAAGDLDGLMVYAIIRRGPQPFDGQVVQYRHQTHGLTPIGPAPDDEACRRLFGIDADTLPQLLLVLTVDPAPTVAKYGARAGRFLLQQSGHALATIGLRLAATEQRRRQRSLHGYITGGTRQELAAVLGLDHTRARILGGYAVGR